MKVASTGATKPNNSVMLQTRETATRLTVIHATSLTTGVGALLGGSGAVVGAGAGVSGAAARTGAEGAPGPVVGGTGGRTRGTARAGTSGAVVGPWSLRACTVTQF